MKKAILFIVLALFMINVSCGSSGSSHSSSGSTAVTLRLGQPSSSASVAGAVSSSAVPSGVAMVRVTVSADDIATIIKEVSVAGQSSVTITLDIPNGPNRHILVEALNASGSVLYSGETIVNLNGQPVQVTISMSPSCNLYVDEAGVDESDCTDSSNPCRTITHALTQTDGNVNVCVAAGWYDSEGGEDFPLNLSAGTNLKCTGGNHTTYIDGRYTDGFDTIYGAAGAKISGCTVYADWYAYAIDDKGEVITVDDCVIDGSNQAVRGINLSADSTVQNSTITRFGVGEGGALAIYVSGGSPVISGNTLTDNYTGIYVETGSPAISGNTMESNDYGIHIQSGSAVIRDNNIGVFNTSYPYWSNYYGIYIDAGTPIITGNTIIYNSEGIYIYSGDPVINNSTLSCNYSSDLNNFRTEGTINARDNWWDNVPAAFSTECSGVGGYTEDICSSGGAVDAAGAQQAPACIIIPQ